MTWRFGLPNYQEVTCDANRHFQKTLDNHMSCLTSENSCSKLKCKYLPDCPQRILTPDRFKKRAQL